MIDPALIAAAVVAGLGGQATFRQWRRQRRALAINVVGGVTLPYPTVRWEKESYTYTWPTLSVKRDVLGLRAGPVRVEPMPEWRNPPVGGRFGSIISVDGTVVATEGDLRAETYVKAVWLSHLSQVAARRTATSPDEVKWSQNVIEAIYKMPEVDAARRLGGSDAPPVVEWIISERQQVLPAVKALLDKMAVEHDITRPDKFPDESMRVLAKVTAWSRT
jgi:hypothetical protein